VKNNLHTTSTGQTTHQDSVKKNCLRRVLFHKLCLRRNLFRKLPAAYFVIQNVVCGAFYFSVLFSLPIHWYGNCSEFKYSVITTTQFVQNSNEECQITNPLSSQTSRDTSRTTPIRFQNSFLETTYLLKRNMWWFHGSSSQTPATITIWGHL